MRLTSKNLPIPPTKKSSNFSAERAIYEVGEKAMALCLERGDISALQRICVDANSATAEVSAAGIKALESAIRIALRMFRSFENKGFSFGSPLPSENEVIYAATSKNGAMVSHYLQHCIDLAIALRSKGSFAVRLDDSGAAYVARFIPAGK